MFPAFVRRSSVAVVLAVWLLATGCSSPDDSGADEASGGDEVTTTTPDGAASTSGSTTEAPGGSTTSRVPPSASDQQSVDLASVAPMVLIQFGQAWADANWKAVAAVGNGDVVNAATEAHIAGAEPPVNGDNVAAVVENCQARLERNTWTCQLDYGAEGSATAFAMILEQTPEGLRITGLSPAGAEDG